MTAKTIFDTFVVYDQSWPVSLTTDTLFEDKVKADVYADGHNRQYEGNRFFKPVLVTTLDDYIYKVKQDALSEGRTDGRDAERREREGE
jgi:hypothetical protein